jgi:Reverse transcriptase (RNA-dependent DNA polymerase)
MSVTAKLHNRIRIRNGLNTSLIYHQNGFRSERATSQHVLAARRIFEKIKESSEGRLIAIFIDFSKAFDNVPEELVEAVMSTYCGPEEMVEYSNDQFTNFIDLSVEVFQGDTLASYLFVIVFNYVMRVASADQSFF